MVTQLLILGAHIQALGLARQAYKKGLRVSVITDDACSVARWSRMVHKTYVYRDEGDLLALLRSLVDKQMMLFPTSDDYIDFLVAHREELEQLFYVALPDNKTIGLFSNKRNTYQFAEQCGVAHPKSWYPMSMIDVNQIAQVITYPCVIKPAVMYSFHKQFGKKAFLCANQQELIARLQMIQNGNFPLSKMVIQEFLAGGAKSLYSFGTFAVDGESLVDIQVNRIRQNPMTFGNSTTYCITCHIPEIEQAAKKILSLTHYTGMGEVEFMYDKGEYKFLEINTRAWKWHTITNQQGFSFIAEWINYLNGGIERIDDRRKNEAAWVERLTDTAVVMKEFLHGRMKISTYFKTMFRKKELAVWSWHDPLPAIMYVLLSPILYIKRY